MAKTLLVVDDDPDFSELLEAVLTPEGYTVVPCSDPTQAQQMARQLRPDAIMVDVIMRGLNGWQVIEQLKADSQTARIPIVVCTAAAFDAMQQVAQLREWRCHVLLKPFELVDLFSTLAKAIAQDKAG